MLKIIIRSFLVIVIISIIAILVVIYGYFKFTKTPISIKNGSEQKIYVKAGDNISKVYKHLNAANISLGDGVFLNDFLGEYYFQAIARLNSKAHLLKIGDYKITDDINPEQLIDKLTTGDVIKYKITFLEGWTFDDFLEKLKLNKDIMHTNGEISKKDIMQKIGSDKFYEGMFFPDTYNFTSQDTDFDILLRSYKLMQKELADAWDKREKDSFLRTPYQMLILASIIEKETSLDKERTKVSGVFHRRIAKDMPLQTDPTVVYGMGDKYKGKLLYSDLKKETPYNTYLHKGLTPTPISMPGKESLLAAGQPDKGESLYFVATGTGGHKFSNTYEEHLKAVAEYRKNKKETK